MTDNLRYGEPPEDAQDIGVTEINLTISNMPGSGVAGREDLHDLYGLRLPNWAVVREVLRRNKNRDKPYKTRIPGIGTLVVGGKGWQVK